MESNDVSRRDFLRRGVSGLTIGAAATALAAGSLQDAEACSKCQTQLVKTPPPKGSVEIGANLHDEKVVSLDRSGAPPIDVAKPLDPTSFLTHFDHGTVSKLPDGRTLREYTMVGMEEEVEVANGVAFPAWTFNGGVPGPTIRCTEGDLLRIHFHNYTKFDHTMHFHGIHPSNMDGAFEIIPPGGYFRYEFEAEPFGCFLYHCHMAPLRKHIARGMYGAFIVDPKEKRLPAQEMVMVMSGFDTQATNDSNAFYAVNGKAFCYRDYPIKIKLNELVRIYLVNITEFDLINSFHLHGNLFKLFRTGTRLDNYEITDTVMLCQGERSILEFKYKHPGRYLFHAHQNEFAERGWLGIFEVAA